MGKKDNFVAKRCTLKEYLNRAFHAKEMMPEGI